MLRADRFYVYQLARPWNGVPCYIGKGYGIRWRCHAKLGEHHYNSHLARIFKIAAGTPLLMTFVRRWMLEDEALALEMQLIASIGRSDLRRGPLANQTDGGEHSANLSAASRAKIVAANNQRWIANRRAQLIRAVEVSAAERCTSAGQLSDHRATASSN